MTRQEAYEAMKNGSKVTHGYFSEGEYYYMTNNEVVDEYGVYHTREFWDKVQYDWRETGWEIYNNQ